MPERLWTECPECEGDGKIEYEVPKPDYRYGGELVGEVRDCETCEGRGEIEQHEEE
jgi:DnaJ-class molecular chaperone